MVKVDLSIIILNYNTRDFLQGSLQSIEEADLVGIGIEIIIVDNASTDGSLEAIGSFQFPIPNLQLIKNKENLGFSRGNNVGVRYARGRYVLFLNPDTVVSKDSLKVAYEYMEEHPDVGVCGVRLELADGTLDDACHRGFPTPWNSLTHFLGLDEAFPKSRIFSRYTLGWLIDSKEPHEVDSISGAFFFLRRKAAEQVACLPARQGWWDEDFFWYGEDLDFCYRLKEKSLSAGRQGWKVVFLPWVKVLHFRGVASGIKGHSKEISTATFETKIKSAKASVEAMRIFYKKHYLDKYPLFVNWLVLLAMNFLEKWRVWRVK